ncbi:hypothetical protein EOM09_04915 [bacterium]|nr:hypothetical protein [bacterium]
MEIKKFNDYTEGERKELLLHWWHYYGKGIYTFAELEKFMEMIDQNSEQVMMIAVLSYAHNMTSEPILAAMRNNDLDGLLNSLPVLEKQNDEFKTCYAKAEDLILGMLVKTHDNPEPPVPTDLVIVIEDKGPNLELKN